MATKDQKTANGGVEYERLGAFSPQLQAGIAIFSEYVFCYCITFAFSYKRDRSKHGPYRYC
jgi:hypothetical protein